MVCSILKYGAAVLEQESQPVTEFDHTLKKLVEDMFESMYAANGVGLAAPQIGLSLKLAIIDITSGKDRSAKLVLANPKILSGEGAQKEEEGCLSFPGLHADVRRPMRVTIVAQDVTGKQYTRTGEGLLARALCHETDHLHGKLFISHLSLLKRDIMRRKARKLARSGEWD